MKIIQIISAITEHRSGEHEIFGLADNGSLYSLTRVWVDNARPDTSDGTNSEPHYRYEWNKLKQVFRD